MSDGNHLLIRPASPVDRAGMELLLSAAKLPLGGFADHLLTALVAESSGILVGCVAVEIYGEHALLRSLALDAQWRGRGVGRRLVQRALALARTRGVSRVWLLTTTADRYFARLGFAVVERGHLPAALAPSAELRGACPASALAMSLSLRLCRADHGTDS